MNGMRHYSAEQRARWVRFVQAQNPDVDPRSIRVMDEMRMVAHLLYQIGEDSVEPTGLSYAQFRILQMLYFVEMTTEQNGLNPSEISDLQGTGRNTVSGLIRSLEEARFIERQLDNEDRRKFNIRLTDAGRQVVRQSGERHLRTVHDIFSELSASELDTLSELLSKLNRRAVAVRQNACGAGGTYASDN